MSIENDFYANCKTTFGAAAFFPYHAAVDWTIYPPVGIQCPDQFVALIQAKFCTHCGCVKFIKEAIYPTTKKNREKLDQDLRDSYASLPTIILVLESPHKDEYDHALRQAIGPAVGHTGMQIRNILLSNILEYEMPVVCQNTSTLLVTHRRRKKIHGGRYRILLVNAIQFQCSLGAEPRLYRDNLFAAMWNGLGKADFCNRIEAYKNQFHVAVVINGCTDLICNNSKYKHAVQDEIESIFDHKQFLLLECAHPSSACFCAGFKDVY
jgi:hypothetical protein